MAQEAASGGCLTFAISGLRLTIANASWDFSVIFHTGDFYWDGTMQEFIAWGADQYSNQR